MADKIVLVRDSNLSDEFIQACKEYLTNWVDEPEVLGRTHAKHVRLKYMGDDGKQKYLFCEIYHAKVCDGIDCGKQPTKMDKVLRILNGLVIESSLDGVLSPYLHTLDIWLESIDEIRLITIDEFVHVRNERRRVSEEIETYSDHVYEAARNDIRSKARKIRKEHRIEIR